MAAIPGSIDTAQQPPMTVPLRHFIVGLGFLVGGSALGLASVAGVGYGLDRLAHLHLLLAGWVCITIMGAMTQFVPVWSGTELHSRRLASVQLGLVTVGLVGFAVSFVLVEVGWLAVFGGLTVAGFWVFIYNIARTLTAVGTLDVTERHFLAALVFFFVLTVFGMLLTLDFSVPVVGTLRVSHAGFLAAHATFAVFGAVLTTVYGALYQLGTMFTGTELRGIDHYLRAVEEFGHPAGVAILATGRLLEIAPIARIGGVFVLVATVSFGTVLTRKLYEMELERTPMHSRYFVAIVALWLWAIVSVPAWLSDPIAPEHLFGASGSGHLLVLGVVGFVVFGTLYHIVPFVIWVHRYSDKLGLEDVPMIEGLYSHRLAAVDGSLLFVGTVALVGSELVYSTRIMTALGGVLIALGSVVFSLNMLLVMYRHSPQPLDRVLLGGWTPRRSSTGPDGTDEQAPSDTNR